MTSCKGAVKNSDQGVVLCLHVVPGSSEIVFPAGYNQWRKCIEIKVRAAAKDNKANTEVLQTIAGFFKIAPKDVILISGQKSREKTVSIKKIPFETISKRLEESLHER
jgi:hypothetical protein